MMQTVICPTITAFDSQEYRLQIERVTGFAKRIHIDLMDGQFAPSKSPDIEHIWWPHYTSADIHLMYQKPMDYLDILIKHKPHMVIIHNEANVHHMLFAASLHKHDIKAGLAILSETPIEWARQIMHSFDQVLIFSGNLGYHGGQLDAKLIDKVKYVKTHHHTAEIAWDGGVNDQNIKMLSDAGVDVLNVGGYIQNNKNPKSTYDKLKALVETSK